MKTMWIAPLVALAAFACVVGCGQSPAPGPAKVAPPKTPGDPAALIGTTWSSGAAGFSLTFKDATNVEVTNPKLKQPLNGQYTIKDGVLAVNAVVQSLTGTWDGHDLILNGTQMTKQ